MLLNNTLLLFLFIIVFFWLVGLTVLLFKALGNYNRLTFGVTKKTLTEVLNNFLESEKLTKSELQKVLSEIKSLKLESESFIQKIGLVRFNPFSDTGGDQSFSLAILDEKENGIVITSLFARTGVRWYVKKVHLGRGIEHDLSKEEKEAIKKS